MNPQVQLWMPSVVALLGTLIVVVFTAWLNTRTLSVQIETLDKKLSAQIEALRAEMRQGFAELRLEFHTELSQLTRRVERLEEVRGLVRP